MKYFGSLLLLDLAVRIYTWFTYYVSDIFKLSLGS